MITAESSKNFVLCITDGFTKYAIVTSIPNKEAETVADTIFKECICKFRNTSPNLPRWRKPIPNKLFAHLFKLLNMHTKAFQCKQSPSQSLQQDYTEILGILHQ